MTSSFELNSIEKRLVELSIILPPAAKPAANYVPYVVLGDVIFISGQIPMVDGKIAHRGKVGDTITVEQAQGMARLCAINVIAQAKAALNGDLSRITRIVRLGGFVNAADDFKEHSAVINGASDLMVNIFGRKIGTHARAAVGCSSLPFGVAVEVEATIAYRK